MTDGTKPSGRMPVPDELLPLAEHNPNVIEALREMRIRLEAASGLSVRDIELARLGAAIALAAPAATFHAHITRALEAGADKDDIWGVALGVAPLVGVPRLLNAVPAIQHALG
jgi:alkylhydroperoxidase/carboxymuconolactone decarboxylase family protein YurZ